MPARRPGRSFERSAPTRTSTSSMPPSGISPTIRAGGRKVVIAGWTAGSLDRLAQILAEHGLERARSRSRRWPRSRSSKPGEGALAVLPLEAGFETAALRRRRRAGHSRRPPGAALEEAPPSLRFHRRSLLRWTAGDIVVHADHGIGRFIGLSTIEAAGAPHDCLEIHYAGDDRLFLPVENIELLSRYGSDSAEAVLDKLGGGAWQIAQGAG